MIILGIDPGIAIVGWGVLEYNGSKFKIHGFGSIQTPAHTPVSKRLKAVHDGICQLVETYHPSVMAIEEIFWNTNQKTGIIVSEARGVILLAAEEKGLEICEYTPLQVKQSVVGYGRAEKKQVISMVTTMLGLKEAPKPDDTADALALAICHGHCGASKIGKYFNN